VAEKPFIGWSGNNKENIIKISIEVNDYLFVKDALQNAIRLLNEQKDISFHLSDDTSAYKVRVCKKSGLPDYELPGADMLLKIKSSNIRNFAVPIDDSLKLKPVYYNGNATGTGSKYKLNSTNIDESDKENKKSLIEKDEVFNNQKVMKCCCKCVIF